MSERDGREGLEEALGTTLRAVADRAPGAGGLTAGARRRHRARQQRRIAGGGAGAAFVGSATFDPAMGPGELVRSKDDGRWAGYVNAGDLVLVVSDPSRALVRQVLATARVEGQPVVQAGRWVAFERGGLRYDVPAWWGVGEEASRSAYAVCAAAEGEDWAFPGDGPQPATFYSSDVVGDLDVTLAAPTRAVAELVLATVVVTAGGPGAGECVTEDFAAALLPPQGAGGS